MGKCKLLKIYMMSLLMAYEMFIFFLTDRPPQRRCELSSRMDTASRRRRWKQKV